MCYIELKADFEDTEDEIKPRTKRLNLSDKSEEPNIMNIAQLSDYLRLSVASIRYKVLHRKIPHEKYGHKELRFDRNEIDEWRRSKRKPALN